MRAEVFKVGDVLIRRDVWFDKVWSVWPSRVLHDDGVAITTARWPGARGYAPATWVSWLETGDASIREQALPNLAARTWSLSPWTWRSTISLRQVVEGRWFAVSAVFDTPGHLFKGWYIDFERPPVRTRYGIDTRDLFIDLIVAPDYSYRWKDEDEFADAISLGLVTNDEVEHVQHAREDVRKPSNWLPLVNSYAGDGKAGGLMTPGFH